MRDDQRSRVYAAESMVRRQLDLAAEGARTIRIAGSVLTVPPEQVFRDVAAVRRYASDLTARGVGCAPLAGGRHGGLPPASWSAACPL